MKNTYYVFNTEINMLINIVSDYELVILTVTMFTLTLSYKNFI